MFELIKDSNLVNFSVVLITIVFVLAKFLPRSVSESKESLIKALSSANEARAKAELQVKELESKLAKSEEEAKKVAVEATTSAQKAREQILEETKIQIANMQEAADREVEARQKKARESIRQVIAEEALQAAEQMIRDESAKADVSKQIQDKFSKELAQL